MNRSGVARTSRTASRRILLRTLVVGGLAGAAWLLSAAAAHAAPVDDGSAGAVLAPLTGVLDTAKPVLTGLVGDVLAPAAGVLAPGGPTVAAVATTSTTAPGSTVIAGPSPATTPDDASRTADRPAAVIVASSGSADRSATRASGLTGTLQELVAPLGVTRALTVPGALITPVSQVALPALAPVTSLLRPVPAWLRLVAAPLTATWGTVTRTVATALPGPRGRPTSDVMPVDDGVHGQPGLPARPGPTVTDAATVAASRASHTEVSTNRRNTGYAAWAVSQNTGEPPSLPHPARMPGQQGSATGVPASGSGSPVQGGAFATVPASVADSMVTFHLLAEPTDVTVPRHDAEAPTVSPD